MVEPTFLVYWVLLGVYDRTVVASIPPSQMRCPPDGGANVWEGPPSAPPPLPVPSAEGTFVKGEWVQGGKGG